MSTTTPTEPAKRNAKLWYEQLMAQKKARRLSQQPTTTATTAVPIAPAVPKSRSATATATAAAASKKQPQQKSSRRESPSRRTATTTASKVASQSSPKQACKSRTSAAASASNNDTAQTSHAKAKAWFERTYGSGDTATEASANVSAVPSSPCAKPKDRPRSSSSSSSSSGVKVSTVTTAAVPASAKKATARRPLSLPNNTATLDSSKAAAAAKAAVIRKARAWYERTMAASLSKHDAGDDEDDDDTVSTAYDWGHEFHHRDQSQKLATKGSRRNVCWYMVQWVGLLAVAAALTLSWFVYDDNGSARPNVVWNQPVDHVQHSLTQWSSSTTTPPPPTSMPCFFSFPDIEHVEHQALHCRGDGVVRIPCPAHGHCSNGILQSCHGKGDNGKHEDDNDDQYWQVSPSGTACIWTPRAWHQVQFWKNVLTEQSIQSLCTPQGTKWVAAWDPTTGRPLFSPSALANAGWSNNHGPTEDTKFWSMVAANGPNGQAPIFIVRQSFADPSLHSGVTAGSTPLVGLHPSQPLELPPACQARHGWVRAEDTTWKTLFSGFMVALVALFAAWLLFGSQALLGRSK
jgi:hypothetical protein